MLVGRLADAGFENPRVETPTSTRRRCVHDAPSCSTEPRGNTMRLMQDNPRLRLAGDIAAREIRSGVGAYVSRRTAR
jgi:hypothetical protein